MSPKNPDGLNIVSLVGLGGIGKTTLAQLVCKSEDVIQNFEPRIWVCVSEPFDEVRIAKAILEDVEGSAPNLFELNTALRRIREHVQRKKFLLVLDDVWTEDFMKWEQLWNSLGTGAPGSTIIVTTRNERVATAMMSSYVLQLGVLSSDDSWLLFKKIAFHEKSKEDCERFKVVGRQISDKCKGLPLTVKMVASLMNSKTTPKDWLDVCASEFWEMKEAEGLFPPLMLSYYDLQPFMKRCFSFCAVFPKDHVINADDLIKLWMAQGYLDSAKDAMEDLGQDYLQNLTRRSFFQDVRAENNGKRIVGVKMHDMVHDLAQYLTKNECSVLEINCELEQKIESSHKRARHLTLIRSEDGHFPKVPNVERLCTYWVQSFYDSPPIGQHDTIEAEFFSHLPRLKALNLSRNRIGGLAKEIGNLVHLKFLNLSYNPLLELPPALCDLYNLQTLKLSACIRLRKLPREIGKLVDLRHLEIDRTDSLKTLPKGIGKMGSLQTLNKFVVGRGKDTIGEEPCDLEELNKLNNLRGCLKIEGLGHVLSAEEAKRGELHKKSHLLDIHMDFGQTGRQEVIETLQVHENVQTLQISSYSGTKLPDWITVLPNLQKLHLQDCKTCTDIPPLGRLPSLETLYIEGMSNVKILGLDFLGVCHTMNGNTLSEGKTTLFPLLKLLKISKMEKWEEWRVDDDRFEVMPRLRCLKVVHCAKLKGLPVVLLQKRPIWKLRIEGCPLVEEQYNRETGEELSKISHIRKIRVC